MSRIKRALRPKKVEGFNLFGNMGVFGRKLKKRQGTLKGIVRDPEGLDVALVEWDRSKGNRLFSGTPLGNLDADGQTGVKNQRSGYEGNGDWYFYQE